MEDAKLLHRQLQKHLSKESINATETVDILQALEKVNMTVEILKETKLGHTVGKLRKHEHEKVASNARSLLKSWKAMAAVSPRPGSNTLLRTISSTSVEDKKLKTSSTGSNGLKPASKPAAVKTATMTQALFIPDGMDKVRATVRTKMKEILEMSEGGNPMEVAVAIEVSMSRMFNMGGANEKKKEYTAKFRQLSFNLKKNGQLREDLLQDLVNAEQLITMTAEQLATDEKRDEIQKLRDDAFQKSRLDWAEANEDKINQQCGIKPNSGLFTCGRCKSSKTSNTQKQTRSADEPMTVFVHCHNCGNRWKC